MANILLITGGARSGKSAYALNRAVTYPTKTFIATAEAFDDEMRERIARHRAERGDAFRTIEEPIYLARAIHQAAQPNGVILIDCLTVWLANLMHHLGEDAASYEPIEELIAILTTPPCDIILVTNEVGNGIVPGDSLSRYYRDMAGKLNQRIAAIANEVTLSVCGIPLRVK